jgi:hypothetical protein
VTTGGSVRAGLSLLNPDVSSALAGLSLVLTGLFCVH